VYVTGKCLWLPNSTDPFVFENKSKTTLICFKKITYKHEKFHCKFFVLWDTKKIKNPINLEL
jgi:hypothetical protein